MNKKITQSMIQQLKRGIHLKSKIQTKVGGGRTHNKKRREARQRLRVTLQVTALPLPHPVPSVGCCVCFYGIHMLGPTISRKRWKWQRIGIKDNEELILLKVLGTL